MTANPLVAALEDAVEQARALEAPLNERLTLIADTVRGLSSVFAEAVDRMVERLQQAGAGEAAPGPGEMMPGFMLPDAAGRLVGLDQMLDCGPVAISFNRGHWCPYCRINVVALSEVQEKVRAMGCQVVAITPERQRFTAALQSDAQAPFPVLTDMDNGYALSLNLAIWVGDEMKTMIAGAGWDVPSYQGNPSWMLPIPATFVVGTDGRIVARYVDPDYRRRMDIDRLLAALEESR
jgi:peroxiredoxin